jgi:UDP-N-acetyl-D-mannosaminuronic acid transferase (WecB/TagA/CpsF family)
LLSTQKILGVPFFTGTVEQLFAHTREAGLVVFPSAPVLAAMEKDVAHRQAVESADLAVADSGWMVLLWLALRGCRIPRISGLRYLERILQDNALRQAGASFWVMPSAADAEANRAWLATQGIPVEPSSTYLAPRYGAGALRDDALLAAVEAAQPAFVFLCVGGGVQERLGHYLRTQLSYKPTILCIGAAIAFLSGRQVSIPTWADRLFLGWLFRIFSNPGLYFPRYWKSVRLAVLLWRHGETSLSAAPRGEPAG